MEVSTKRQAGGSSHFVCHFQPAIEPAVPSAEHEEMTRVW